MIFWVPLTTPYSGHLFKKILLHVSDTATLSLRNRIPLRSSTNIWVPAEGEHIYDSTIIPSSQTWAQSSLDNCAAQRTQIMERSHSWFKMMLVVWRWGSCSTSLARNKQVWQVKVLLVGMWYCRYNNITDHMLYSTYYLKTSTTYIVTNHSILFPSK